MDADVKANFSNPVVQHSFVKKAAMTGELKIDNQFHSLEQRADRSDLLVGSAAPKK